VDRPQRVFVHFRLPSEFPRSLTPALRNCISRTGGTLDDWRSRSENNVDPQVIPHGNGQAESQHADEVYAPDARPHGNRTADLPVPYGLAALRPCAGDTRDPRSSAT
jgi:hypothetical protein